MAGCLPSTTYCRLVITYRSLFHQTPPCALHDPAGGVEVDAGTGRLGKSGFVDLGNIGRGVPGGNDRGSADVLGLLGRHRVEPELEHRVFVREVGEQQVGLIRQLPFGFGQDRLTPMPKGILAGPDRSDDFQAGIVTPGMNPDQPAARSQRPSQRNQHVSNLAFDRRLGPVGLRGDHQVVLEPDLTARLGDEGLEQKPAVGPVQHQHCRVDVQGVAGDRAGTNLPVQGQLSVQTLDLLGEVIGRGSLEGDFAPNGSLR